MKTSKRDIIRSLLEPFTINLLKKQKISIIFLTI